MRCPGGTTDAERPLHVTRTKCEGRLKLDLNPKTQLATFTCALCGYWRRER